MKTGLIALLLLVLTVAILFVAASHTHAAQQTISAIGVPANLGVYRAAANGEFAKVQSNFVELYTGKVDASCFATESAFNACFDLTWAAGGGSVSDTAYGAGWNGDTTTAPSKNAVFDKIETIAGGTMTYPGAGVPVSTGSAWGTSLAASSFLVGDCTAGPCLDGTSDGGTIMKWYGPGGFWQAIQAGNSTANRSWRLPIAAAPSAGTTYLMNMDEYGQMGFLATNTYLTPSGSAASLTSFPTLNQNTTGSAATLTTSRTIGGTSFNGSANIDISYANLTNKPTIPTASDTAYDATSWDANTDVPTKNAVRDKIETLGSAFNPAVPGAIGGTTPAAGTFTTLSAGAAGFAVDADGDTTAKSFVATRTTSPQALDLYEGTGGGSNKVTIAPSAALGADVTITAEAITQTIASGTMALGTTAINSGACTTITPVTATGVATTDTVNWGFNGDPTGVTGYAASANGMLTIIVWPTSGNIAAKVCNNTASAVTPGSSVTINWRVMR